MRYLMHGHRIQNRMAYVACNYCAKHKECSPYPVSKMYCNRCAEALGLKTAKVETKKTTKRTK